MDELIAIYLTVGAIFLMGLLTDLIGRCTRLPRVTLLLVAGFLIGPSVFDLLPDYGELWFRGVAEFALTMVGFLLGGHFTPAASTGTAGRCSSSRGETKAKRMITR